MTAAGTLVDDLIKIIPEMERHERNTSTSQTSVLRSQDNIKLSSDDSDKRTAAMGEHSYAQNETKADVIISLQPQREIRNIKHSKQLKDRLLPELLHLVLLWHPRGSNKAEWDRTVQAVKMRWCEAGELWDARTLKPTRRLMFMSAVCSTSGSKLCKAL